MYFGPEKLLEFTLWPFLFCQVLYREVLSHKFFRMNVTDLDLYQPKIDV